MRVSARLAASRSLAPGRASSSLRSSENFVLADLHKPLVAEFQPGRCHRGHRRAGRPTDTSAPSGRSCPHRGAGSPAAADRTLRAPAKPRLMRPGAPSHLVMPRRVGSDPPLGRPEVGAPVRLSSSTRSATDSCWSTASLVPPLDELVRDLPPPNTSWSMKITQNLVKAHTMGAPRRDAPPVCPRSVRFPLINSGVRAADPSGVQEGVPHSHGWRTACHRGERPGAGSSPPERRRV